MTTRDTILYYIGAIISVIIFLYPPEFYVIRQIIRLYKHLKTKYLQNRSR